MLPQPFKPHARETSAVRKTDKWSTSQREEAFNILLERARRSYTDDIRGKDIEKALSFLQQIATRPGPYDQFRRAMEIQDPICRMQELYDALNKIRAHI